MQVSMDVLRPYCNDHHVNTSSKKFLPYPSLCRGPTIARLSVAHNTHHMINLCLLELKPVTLQSALWCKTKS